MDVAPGAPGVPAPRGSWRTDPERVRLELALAAGQIGCFEWDVRGDVLRWDERLMAIFGVEPAQFGGTIAAFFDAVVDEDRERVRSEVERAVASVGRLSVGYRIHGPDGAMRWVEARGHVVSDDEGGLWLVGTAVDNTELHTARELVARTVEQMTDAFFSVDRDWVFTYVNGAAEQLLGHPRKDLLGRSLWDVFPDIVGSGFERHYRRTMDSTESVEFTEFHPPLGRWFEVHVHPMAVGIAVYFRDATDRKLAEEERNRLLAAEKAARSRLAFLADASARFGSAQRREELFDELTRLAVPSLGDWCSVYVPDGDELVRVAAAHADPSLDPLAQSLKGAHPVPIPGGNHIARVYRTRSPVVLPDIDAEMLEEIAVTSAYARAVRVLGLHGGMAFPVVVRGRCLAVVSFLLGTVGRRFGDDDVLLAGELLNRAAVALDTIDQLERQTTVAQALQAAVLPALLPRVPGLDIGAAYRPATAGEEVGGDWYDAFLLPDGRIGVVVGDVVGHGLPAAALMGQLRNALRAYAVEGHGPARTLQRLAAMLSSFEPEAMATVAYAELDPDHSVATVASAGHPPLVMVARDGTAQLCEIEAAPPIGAPMAAALVDTRVPIEPESRLLLYTDGLVERRDTSIDVGLARLLIAAEAIAGGDAGDAQQSCERVLRMLLASGHEDDACLLVVRFAAV